MIPDSNLNIYSNNENNIRAILNFYFQIPDGDLKSLFEQRKLTINQIEYIAKHVSKHLYFIENSVGNSGITISNAMQYGIEALTVNEGNWNGSKNRKEITKKLRELILKNENVDSINN